MGSVRFTAAGTSVVSMSFDHTARVRSFEIGLIESALANLTVRSS